jgi:hypothetical protein
VASGTVGAVAPRPGGGWFLGGTFTQFGGKSRGGLAATTAGGAVAGWNPKARGGSVDAMALSPDGSVLYVAGRFTSIGQQARAGLAAFATADLSLTSWAPSPVSGGSVSEVAVGPDGTVYVGGSFTGIGGNGRARIAAITPAGSVTTWNPGASDTVKARVGAIDPASGDATGWTGTGADAEVRALALSGSTLFVGGSFAALDGVARARIGALDASTGTATSFAPGADGPVSVLNLSGDGSTLVAGGSFAQIGGADARRLASIDTATGTADASWTPNPNDDPEAIGRSADGQELLVGGRFTGAGGVVRHHLAAIDDATGEATAWDPGADDDVFALALDPGGSTVYAGGAFTHVGGAAEQRLVAIDAATGEVVTAFHVNATNRVRSLATAGDLLYVGGTFQRLGGQPRPYAGAVRISTASVDPTWLPAPDGLVRSMAPDGDGRVYMGGEFSHIGGSDRDHVAAVNATTGANIPEFATASPKYRTYQVAFDGTFVYAAMGGPGGRLRAYRSNGSVAWEVTADGDVQACGVAGGFVFIGGHFTKLDGLPRAQIGAADPATGDLDPWAPGTNGSIWTLEGDGTTIDLGGTFTRVKGLVQAGYARFDVS